MCVKRPAGMQCGGKTETRLTVQSQNSCKVLKNEDFLLTLNYSVLLLCFTTNT